MKNEKRILFSTQMVHAILGDRKTMTRRIVKDKILQENKEKVDEEFLLLTMGKCPYGEMGDLLYVNETHYVFGQWIKNGLTVSDRQKWKFVAKEGVPVYFEDVDFMTAYKPNSYREEAYYKRNARFMPKKYARTWLEITDIRVEKLQDINEFEALNEGIKQFTKDAKVFKYGLEGWEWTTMPRTPEAGFKKLWQSINGEQSWNENPFVWVIGFKRINK